ncbi:hypothetical protein [Tenacibaculum sp. M341]|uniref:hypothetical protein n=1 Tax=Tenacibaculum sp. M341 TaxID=2530339 RepID=UPI00104D50F3|nr:hypothetical protein [Tenacibaculum sp. M341]TCI85432.1 hypothetical protein EYW44_16920 [Tenacibaculum sp. M341]
MFVYCLVIELLLFVWYLTEFYKFYRYKYESVEVIATVVNKERSILFQRASTKFFTGEKRVLSITFEYNINERTFRKEEKILEEAYKEIDENCIKVLVLKKFPIKCTLKSHNLRFQNALLVLVVFIFWTLLIVILSK